MADVPSAREQPQKKFSPGEICEYRHVLNPEPWTILYHKFNRREKQWWYRVDNKDQQSKGWHPEKDLRFPGEIPFVRSTEPSLRDFIVGSSEKVQKFDSSRAGSTLRISSQNNADSTNQGLDFGRYLDAPDGSYGLPSESENRAPNPNPILDLQSPSDSLGRSDDLETETSDTQSIISLANSGFSTTSTISSQSSISGPVTAKEQIVDLLITDEELEDLLRECLDRISVERFRRNFSILLKRYALELQVVANTSEEREASFFVKKQRRTIASKVASKFPSEQPLRANKDVTFFWDGRGHESDNASSGDEADLDADLDHIRTFLIAGPPFQNMRQNLREFLDPAKTRLVVKDVEETADHIEGCNLSREENLTYDVEERHHPAPQGDAKSPFSDLFFQYVSYWQRPKSHLGSGVAPGFRRVEWTCDCGDRMCWDIQGVSQAYVSELSEYLDCAARDRPGRDRSSNSLPGSSNGDLEAPTPALVRDHGRRHPARYVPPPDTPTARNIPIQTGIESNYRHRGPRFFELCINSDYYRKSVLEIDIKDATCDRDLFRLIARAYWEERKKRHSFSFGVQKFQFQKPSKMSFRRFELEEQSDVALFSEELPPSSEVASDKYHYDPCPQQLDRVMPEHVFWHFFFSGSKSHNKNKWMARLPKKVNHSIFDGIDESREREGWGVHINEGPNLSVIFASVGCGLIASGVLAVIAGLVMKDAQAAFGVGSYFTAVQAAWMAALYFK